MSFPNCTSLSGSYFSFIYFCNCDVIVAKKTQTVSDRWANERKWYFTIFFIKNFFTMFTRFDCLSENSNYILNWIPKLLSAVASPSAAVFDDYIQRNKQKVTLLNCVSQSDYGEDYLWVFSTVSWRKQHCQDPLRSPAPVWSLWT